MIKRNLGKGHPPACHLVALCCRIWLSGAENILCSALARNVRNVVGKKTRTTCLSRRARVPFLKLVSAIDFLGAGWEGRAGGANRY